MASCSEHSGVIECDLFVGLWTWFQIVNNERELNFELADVKNLYNNESSWQAQYYIK